MNFLMLMDFTNIIVVYGINHVVNDDNMFNSENSNNNKDNFVNNNLKLLIK